MKGSEIGVQKACDADDQCTGYDYKNDDQHGKKCQQKKYPEKNHKGYSWKLCEKKKGAVFSIMSFDEIQ